MQEKLQPKGGEPIADEWKTHGEGSSRWQKAEAGRAAAQGKLNARAAMRSKSRHVVTTQREDNRWSTLDGANARGGGVQMLNDVRGTGRAADVSIYADRSVAVRRGRELTPLRASYTAAERMAAEVLTDYGARYWRAFGLQGSNQKTDSPRGLDWLAATVSGRSQMP